MPSRWDIMLHNIAYAANISLKGTYFLEAGNLELARNAVKQNN